jgi:MoaA/NifB/PqqE/SkfB family radical SAM enzyme
MRLKETSSKEQEMSIRTKVMNLMRPLYRRSERIRNAMVMADTGVDAARHSLAALFPRFISAQPRELFVALTAKCNYACIGCRYGRDFMPGSELSLEIVRELLIDAKEIGFDAVRLYGGEPLLHKDLNAIVQHATSIGLRVNLTTNGALLREKIDDLYDSGLRDISIGFYGTDGDYDNYVQRKDRFRRMEIGVAYLRERYGKTIKLNLAWLLMRPTVSTKSLHQTWEFSRKYDAPIGINLIHYSLPYFVEGKDGELQFGPSDRPALDELVKELEELKHQRPDLILATPLVIRSIPDWLLKKDAMRVPCTNYRLVWVGPDGTVQLCYVTFKLGNLHESRLRDLLLTEAHHKAARDAFRLACPNCNCSYDSRTLSHYPSRRYYQRAVHEKGQKA